MINKLRKSAKYALQKQIKRFYNEFETSHNKFYKSFSLVPLSTFARPSNGRKPEYMEDINLSDLMCT